MLSVPSHLTARPAKPVRHTSEPYGTECAPKVRLIATTLTKHKPSLIVLLYLAAKETRTEKKSWIFELFPKSKRPSEIHSIAHGPGAL